MALKIEKIGNGTVIDHIAAGSGLKVLKMLGLEHGQQARVALIMNVKSKKIGRKDVLKIEGMKVDSAVVDRISLASPDATINLIAGGRVERKWKARLQKSIAGVVSCPNPKCITNFEHVASRFSVKGGKLKCEYCERVFLAGEIS